MELNRLKVVLVEQKRTGKWLAEKLGKNEATVSRWCANVSQPSLETLFAIAKALNVDIRGLIVGTKRKDIFTTIGKEHYEMMMDEEIATDEKE